MDESAFSAWIGTDYSATDEDCLQLKQLLLEPTEKLAKMQAEVDRQNSIYIDLSNQYEALSRTIEEYRALTSPIRRVPIDIIQEIFLHCLPTEHNCIMSRYECPMLLTQICSGWRYIAHSTASLWSSIHIVIPTLYRAIYSQSPPLYEASPSQLAHSTEIVDKRATGIRTWLGRSGECPLRISVHSKDESTFPDLYDIILVAIIEFSQRWSVVHFQTYSTPLGRVSALSETDVPLLTSLSIVGQDNHFFPAGTVPSSDPRFLVDSGLLKAPQLRKIFYHNATEDFAQFPLRWGQLTSISLTGFAWIAPQILSLPKIAHILASCPRLVGCTLEVAGVISSDSLEAFRARTISLPCLESMSIQSTLSDLVSLLLALQVPVLQELEFFVSMNMSDESTIDQLISCIDGVAHSLRKLTLDPLFLKKAQFERCLRSCSRLSALALRPNHYPSNGAWTPQPYNPDDQPACTLDDDLLKHLASRDAQEDTLLPELEFLQCSVKVNFSDAAIVEFVQARCSGDAGVKPLKKLWIELGRSQSRPMEELRRYVENGLGCSLYYTPEPVQRYHADDGIPRPHPWGHPLF